MGVQYLMTYMSSDNRKLMPYELRNTRLIIDANNLSSYVSRHFKVPYLYGGNYMDYYNAVDRLIDLLIECEITPIFIFDGCKESDVRLETSMKGFKDKIDRCNKYAINTHELIHPSLLYESFISVLRNKKIEYYATEFEADKEIAKLANRYKCPVLSDDSDFFIYPIKYGFVPIRHLNFEKAFEKSCECCKSKCHQYISCRIFYSDKFTLQDGKIFNPKLLPLFACLCGNDYVTIPLYLSLFYKLRVNFPNKSAKIDAVSKWLNQFVNEQDALTEIVRMCSYKDLQGIQNSNNQYNLNDASAISKVYSVLPEYIQKRFKEYLISPSLLDPFSCGRSLLRTSIENISKPSVNIIAKEHRFQIYSFFVKFYTNFEQFDEYCREQNSFIQNTIKRSLLEQYEYSRYKIDSEECFLRLFLMEFLKSKQNKDANKSALVYLIISVLFEYCHRTNRFNNHTKQLDLYKTLLNCYPLLNNEQNDVLHIDTIHDFNELQTVYLVIRGLLLLDPSDDVIKYLVGPENLFCGTLVYNATRYLQSKRICDDVVNDAKELFKESSLSGIVEIFGDLVEYLTI